MAASLARSLSIAEAKVQYDAQVKKVLSEKVILAWILKSVIEDFSEMEIAEIENCIEEKPEVSCEDTNQSGKPTKIIGITNEMADEEEGTIRYDIRFCAYIPQKEKSIKIIVNVEAQKQFYTGYEIATRGIYYGGRMISAQGNTEFTPPAYDDLKKVYSIWICMNAPKKIGNAISDYSMEKKDLVPGIPDKRSAYDKLSVIIICLNEKEEEQNEFLGMLNTLLSTTKPVQKKLRELEEKYQIEMKEEGADFMCNLSEWVWESGRRELCKDIIENMVKKGLVMEKIIELLGVPESFVREIIEELQEETVAL